MLLAVASVAAAVAASLRQHLELQVRPVPLLAGRFPVWDKGNSRWPVAAGSFPLVVASSLPLSAAALFAPPAAAGAAGSDLQLASAGFRDLWVAAEGVAARGKLDAAPASGTAPGTAEAYIAAGPCTNVTATAQPDRYLFAFFLTGPHAELCIH